MSRLSTLTTSVRRLSQRLGFDGAARSGRPGITPARMGVGVIALGATMVFAGAVVGLSHDDPSSARTDEQATTWNPLQLSPAFARLLERVEVEAQATPTGTAEEQIYRSYVPIASGDGIAQKPTADAAAQVASANDAPAPAVIPNSRFQYPLRAWAAITDRYGVDRGNGRTHGGIDLALGGMWHSPIFPGCTEGTVQSTGNDPGGYGLFAIIDCGDGWSTLLAHMSEVHVSTGDSVDSGTLVGFSGVTGFTTGEHLHFEIRRFGIPVNPEEYIDFNVPPGTVVSTGPTPERSTTPTPTATNTPTPTPTATTTPTPSPTPTKPGATPTAPATSTPTPPAPTPPPATPTIGPTRVPTMTPTPTVAPTRVPTMTPTPTPPPPPPTFVPTVDIPAYPTITSTFEP